MYRRLAFLVVLFAVFFAGTHIASATIPEVYSDPMMRGFSVEEQRGDVKIDGLMRPVGGGSDVKVYYPMDIKTSAESSAIIASRAAVEHKVVSLAENTEIIVQTDDGKSDSSHLTLKSGMIRVKRENGGAYGKLSVYTPTVVFMLKGKGLSDAVIDARDPKNVAMYVIKGRVSMRGLTSDVNAPGVSISTGMTTSLNERTEASSPREYTKDELPNISLGKFELGGDPKIKKASAVRWPMLLGAGAAGILLGAVVGKRRAMKRRGTK